MTGWVRGQPVSGSWSLSRVHQPWSVNARVKGNSGGGWGAKFPGERQSTKSSASGQQHTYKTVMLSGVPGTAPLRNCLTLPHYQC